MFDGDLWLWARFLLEILCIVPHIPETFSSERVWVLATFFLVIAFSVVWVKGVISDPKADMFVRVFFVFLGLFLILVGGPILAIRGWQQVGPFLAPFVVLARLGEGVALGVWFSRLNSPNRRFLAYTLLGMVFLASIAGPIIMALVANAWAVLGAGVSAYQWTKPLEEDGGERYGTPLSLVGFFVIFVAAQFLVSTDPFWASLHRFAVPIGVLLGSKIVSRARAEISAKTED